MSPQNKKRGIVALQTLVTIVIAVGLSAMNKYQLHWIWYFVPVVFIVLQGWLQFRVMRDLGRWGLSRLLKALHRKLDLAATADVRYMLYQPSQGRFYLIASYGFNDEVKTATRLRTDQGVAGKVYNTKPPVKTVAAMPEGFYFHARDNLKFGPKELKRLTSRDMETKSVWGAPVPHPDDKNSALAVLLIDSREVDTFSPTEGLEEKIEDTITNLGISLSLQNGAGRP